MAPTRALQRKVSQLFRMRGWQLRPDAMQRLYELLNGEDDWESQLNVLLHEIEQLPGAKADRCVDKPMVERVFAASSAAAAAPPPDDPATPEHLLSPPTAKPAPPPASHFAVVRARVRRLSYFKPARSRAILAGADDGAPPSVELSRTGRLLGRKGKHILLGVLTAADSGAIALADEDGSVPLDLTGAHKTVGFFTASAVVLVEGEMDDSGVLHVLTLAQPPPPELSAATPAPAPSLGGGAAGPTLSDGGMTMVFSDVWLDDTKTLRRLEAVLRGYEAAGGAPDEASPPVAELFSFVFCGSFCSAPHAAQEGRSTTQLLFRRLAELLGRLPLLRHHSHFLFVPGPADASLGPQSLLHRPPLANVFTAELRGTLEHCHLLPNPARFQLGGQTAIVYREDVLTRTKLAALAPPNIAECDDVNRHLVETMLLQGHLCPVPLAQTASYAPSALLLDAAPDLLVVAGRKAQFNLQADAASGGAREGTVAFSPGSFGSSGKWMVYRAAERVAEASFLELPD
mmetsp:Transcript_20981/g.65684  ORF Transcript_20981/g.65684 Transcript_20981/m.65684 type:complete len:515 (+) Transcript_20981:62-1606(+)